MAVPDPRAEPRVYESEGFVVTLWTYYKPAKSGEVTGRPGNRMTGASTIVLLGLWTQPSPSRWGSAPCGDHSPHPRPCRRGPEASRHYATEPKTSDRRSWRCRADAARRAAPGNVLSTKSGLLFIDFETCCRGPVGFDLAHVPEDVSERYADVDQDLLSQCRPLSLPSDGRPCERPVRRPDMACRDHGGPGALRHTPTRRSKSSWPSSAASRPPSEHATSSPPAPASSWQPPPEPQPVRPARPPRLRAGERERVRHDADWLPGVRWPHSAKSAVTDRVIRGHRVRRADGRGVLS